jgi:transcriptional regulator with XRE-family HTH domain
MISSGLRAWRKGLDITQEQAATMLGCTRRAVVKWETGGAAIPRTVELAVLHLYQRPRIWRLKPLVPKHPNWRGSLYQGEVIVRAVDEAMARTLPSIAYGIAVRRQRGDESFIQPWREHAECDEVLGAAYEAVGYPGILSPTRYYLRYFKDVRTPHPLEITLLMPLDDALMTANRLTEEGAVGIELMDDYNQPIKSVLSA